MKLPRRKFLHLAAGAAALPVMSRIARAQSYPTRPITFNVPFPAGGPTDAIARVMGERMRVALGQTILIENVSGAAGSIGVNGAIYDLSYDLLKNFAPVALLPANPQLIVSKKNVPAANLKELIAWLKANESKAAAGTAGAGSASQIAEIYFQKITGTRFYDGPIPRYRSGLE